METILAAASTAIIAILWLSRARANRKFNAALSVYAEREISRQAKQQGDLQ